MRDIYTASYEEIVTLAYSLGLNMAEQLTVNQQGILGNFYITLGQVILVAHTVGRSYPPFSTSPFEGCVGNGSAFSSNRYGCGTVGNSGRRNSNEGSIQEQINCLQNQVLALQLELENMKNNKE